MCDGKKDIDILFRDITSNIEETRGTYYRGRQIEPIDVIDAFDLDFDLGQVCKYICRAGKKEHEAAIKDLLKAAFYLKRAIARRSETDGDGTC